MTKEADFLRNIIANRRTIKPDAYTGERVDDAMIKQILEQANWAPTHGYTEPWRFTVFKGQGLKSLGEFLANLDQPNTEAESFNPIRFERLSSRPQKASHIIALGMNPGTNPKIPELEELASTAMAVQNMWLMAHSLGLGAYWSTGGLAFRDETRAFLGLPEGNRALGFFYIGVPAKENPVGRRLSDISTKVKWVE